MNFGKKMVELLLFAVNVGAVMLMILSIIASKVSPEKLILPAYTTLVLPLTILLNVILILFWLLLRRWLFLISLIMLIVGFPLVRNTFPVNLNLKPKEAGERSFTLMSYNTHANDLMTKHTEKTPNMVIQYMLQEFPDVLCIQEFSANTDQRHLTKKDLDNIFKVYPYRYVHYQVENGWSSFGVATFSKFPIVSKGQVEFVSQDNSAIFTDLDINGTVIRIYNCHLESNYLTEDDKLMAYRLTNSFDTEILKGTTMHLSRKLGSAYRIRARQADSVAQHIQSSPHPVMVVGDFNDLPSSYAYSKIRGNLQDAFVNRGTGLGWTFIEKIFRFRIDHVLYDSSLEIADFKIDKTNKISDHFPLLGTINIL